MDKDLQQKIVRMICYAFYAEGFPATGDGKVERIAQKLAGSPFPIDDKNIISLLAKEGYGKMVDIPQIVGHFFESRTDASGNYICAKCGEPFESHPKPHTGFIKVFKLISEDK